MAVAAKYNDSSSDWAGPYDYASLAAYLDLVTVMTYDYSYSASRNGPVAPLSWVEMVARYAAAQFGPGKVLLGLAFYGYEWNLSQGGRATAHDYSTILRIVQQYKGQLGFDTNSQSPYADYIQAGDYYRVWFESPRSLAAKMQVIQQYKLAGWAGWRLGLEGTDFWPVLNTNTNPTRPVMPLSSNTPTQRYFPQTGHTLRSLFLKYWEDHQGLELIGYPWTEELEEINPLDGRIYLVQYFERVRLEYQPPNSAATVNEVRVTPLGIELTLYRSSQTPFQRIAAPPGSVSADYYFSQTGHTLSGAFQQFWKTNGGFSFHGLPISEEFFEQSPLDGKVRLVQYFEHTLLEFHPEKTGTPYEVTVGRLGSQLLMQKGWLVLYKN